MWIVEGAKNCLQYVGRNIEEMTENYIVITLYYFQSTMNTNKIIINRVTGH